MIGIYKIENTENGMVYIGKSDDIMRRWEQHIKSLENNSHANARLQKDWNNYKINCFNFSILRTCDKSELSEYEQFYINKYFNIASIYNSQIKTLDNKKIDSEIKINNNIQTLKEMNYVYIPKNIDLETYDIPSVTDKILIYMFQCIYNKNINKGDEIILSMSDFSKRTKSSIIYRDIKNIVKPIIKINNINIIKDFKYKNGIMYITLSKIGSDVLFDKSNYDKYDFNISSIGTLSSRSSIKMLLLLNKENSNNIFTLDYLKDYLNAHSKAYNRYNNFKKEYIQPMLKDLKSIGYNYTYEEIKFGRKVCELKFIKS